MPDTYDRLLGALDGLPGMTSTKPATLEQITPILGTSTTFIVRTFRHQERHEIDDAARPAQFTIFLKYIEGTTALKIAIPPKVADLIMRQRDALTAQARKRTAKVAAATRKASGYRPVPPKRQK